MSPDRTYTQPFMQNYLAHLAQPSRNGWNYLHKRRRSFSESMKLTTVTTQHRMISFQMTHFFCPLTAVTNDDIHFHKSVRFNFLCRYFGGGRGVLKGSHFPHFDSKLEVPKKVFPAMIGSHSSFTWVKIAHFSSSEKEWFLWTAAAHCFTGRSYLAYWLTTDGRRRQPEKEWRMIEGDYRGSCQINFLWLTSQRREDEWLYSSIWLNSNYEKFEVFVLTNMRLLELECT